MKWNSVLMLAACWALVPVYAEDTPSPAPQNSSLGLPSLEQSGDKKSLPDNGMSFPKSNDVVLPDNVPSSRPQPSTSGTNKDKDWLVNGLLELQKKQQEENDSLRQKQRENDNQLIQQEFERQQKVLMGINNSNPLDSQKYNLTGSNSAILPSSPADQPGNLPNGRLSLSGSGPTLVSPANLSSLPELAPLGKNLPYNGSFNKPASAPANSLPNLTGQWNNNNPGSNHPLPVNGQIPNIVTNLAPTPYTLEQQPVLPNPYSATTGSTAPSNPFTSAQAANFLKQLDRQKNVPDPNRPTLKDLNNGIPNPADMQRF
jgi:hypothetical protein